MSNQSEMMARRRPACLDNADEELDDAAVLAWVIRGMPGGRRKYGYRAMAEVLLDMLDDLDIVMARRSELRSDE